jgi:nucleoside 2-deoxyribosyltransferase
MKVIYIAGPFRAANAWGIEQNIRRAEALALEVWRLGAACICPHTNTRFFQNAAPDDVWLKGDIEIMLRCDAVLLTDDWERSSGARAEVAAALALPMPVFRTLDELRVLL